MTLTLEQVRAKSASKLGGLLSADRAAAEALIDFAYLHGVPIVITQGLRTIAEQIALYEQGRTTKGQIVTNAKGGYSYHNFGVAIDFALLLPDGSVSWDMKRDGDKDGKADWDEVVADAKALGWDWGGDWRSFKDYPHFEMTFGLSTAQYRAGVRPTMAQLNAAIAKVKKLTEEENDVKVDKANFIVNGAKAKDGVLIDGTVYVPLREVGDKFGADVTWDNVTKTATVTKGAK